MQHRQTAFARDQRLAAPLHMQCRDAADPWLMGANESVAPCRVELVQHVVGSHPEPAVRIQRQRAEHVAKRRPDDGQRGAERQHGEAQWRQNRHGRCARYVEDVVGGVLEFDRESRLRR